MINLQPFLTQHSASDQRWLRLQNAHIFITGGTGLFGRWFLTALLDANQRLGTHIQATVLTRNPTQLLAEFANHPGAEALNLWQGDVTNFEFPATKFTHVIHMATTSAHETFAGEDSLAKFHMLHYGTERVLQLAAKSGVRKVLFTSSGVAYGAYPQGHVPESYQGAPSPLDAGSGLGQGKRAAEFLCSYYAEKFGFEATIARCFAFAGAGLPLNIHYAIGNFVHDALHAQALTVKGDGSPMRSFLYLGDLVHWLLALLVDGQRNTIYNVGSDQAISIADLAYRVRDLIAPQKTVQILGDRDHNVGNFVRNWYVPDIQKARHELALNVWTSLDDTILNISA
jgi:dTDP-glucose 4,6-dehydratase/UDP-glucose 4-epimerase